MGLFLAELCENNLVLLNLFLFQKNLLADIRLLLINELISKRFHLKFNSIESIKEVFRQIQVNHFFFGINFKIFLWIFRGISIHQM